MLGFKNLIRKSGLLLAGCLVITSMTPIQVFADTPDTSGAWHSGQTTYTDTPLTNLADYHDNANVVVTLQNGTDSTTDANLKYIVDGLKYDISTSTDPNRFYVPEDKAEFYDIGNNEYFTIDLGASYNIEVINIKREYGTSFGGMAIAVAELADFSDAKVIYKQASATLRAKETS